MGHQSTPDRGVSQTSRLAPPGTSSNAINLTCNSPGAGGESRALRTHEGYLTRQVRPSGPSGPARNAFISRYVMEDCCPPQRQKSTGVTHQRRCIRRNSRKRSYCHDNCTCTLLVFLVCIEPLYYTVLNVTSYETLYDSIALQTNKTNKQTPTAMAMAIEIVSVMNLAPFI